MLDKKISVSEQVANLPERGQLIFTWSIPHADDVGLLPFSLKTLKATIVPMMDIDLKDFERHWVMIVEQELIEIFEYDGQKFYRIKTFLKNQTLKRDRQPNTLLQFVHSEKPKESWEKLLKILHLEDQDFQMEDYGFQMDTEVKLSKEKRREEKLSKREGVITPKESANAFFMMVENDSEEMENFITNLSEKTKVPANVLKNEIKKFYSYWTELNSTGKKMRWEKQETFEINRRLSTWFSRSGTYKNSEKNKYDVSNA